MPGVREYGATSIVAFHPTSPPLVALYLALAAVVLGTAWVLRRGVVQ